MIKSKELFNFVTGLTNFKLFCFFFNPALKDFKLPQIFKERGVGRQSPSKKQVWKKPRESKQQLQPSVFTCLCARHPAGHLELLTINI